MHPNFQRLMAIEPERVKDLLDRNDVLLVDVREEDEWRLERIPGAISMPLSCFDATDLPRQAAAQIVLHCLGGARAPKAANLLFYAGHNAALHMKGGLAGWKLAGLETEGGMPPAPLRSLPRAGAPVICRPLAVDPEAGRS